ncbi:MAG: DegV family EDD domain-containing protein [Gemmatimonadetes bacterium]|nr:DegV family EDD domain-containing protein [Gemmatimonadota bacterium]
MALSISMPLKIGYLDGPRLRRTLMAACEYAQSQRTELNRINVFPVPDGDTGTNLALTVRAIADHLRGNRDAAVAVVAQEAAQAAVLGARGNCGMMLSHFLLGFAEDLRDRARITTREFGEALRAGVRRLHEALERPVEGTILTVMRDTAEAADARQLDFAALIQHLVERARVSLARTPELLPVLRTAGVVDAGAKGFVSLLEGVLLFIHGDPVVSGGASEEDTADAAAARVDFPDASERFRFCTEALVRGAALPSQSDVRSELREHGDSLIVIRAGAVLKVHVHTDDPDAVFHYLRGLGTLVTHKAEDMHVQHYAVERAADQHIRLARRPVVVMTDSGADLPEEIVRAHGIHVTPLLLVDSDRTYRDGVDITAEEFHRRLASDESLPTTSQPAPADFLETFARAAEDGEAVVGVTLGSALSGTFRSAAAAAGSFHGAPVHLVDSAGASLLQGLLVMKACELAELGRSPEEIVRELGETRRRSGLLFTLDTFDRLLASGRVGRGRALLGSVLGVKPILELTLDGTVAPVARAMGMARARVVLLDELVRRVPAGAQARFGIVYVGEPDAVEPVAQGLRDRFGRDVEILAAPATPVLATHLGLGTWGVAYLVEED